MTSVAGCNVNHGATTESQILVTFGNTSQKMDDYSALTSIGFNREGCVAGGIPQPLDPSVYGWQYFGSSPGIGKCSFPDAPYNGNIEAEFKSNACQQNGQAWDLIVNPLQVSNGATQPQVVCTLPSTAFPAADGHFGYTESLPSTITIYGSGLSSTYGFPQLYVFDTLGQQYGTSTATSVAADGSSATFPFPQQSGGGALPSLFYFFGIRNFITSPNDFEFLTGTYYSIGSSTSVPNLGPFGIDAFDQPSSGQNCNYDPDSGNTYCTSFNSNYPGHAITYFSTGQLLGWGGTTTVGSQPTAVKVYGSANVCENLDSYGGYECTTEPAKAIVTNMGSNSVSIVDLVNNVLVATIGVGSQPVAVALNSGATYAYVAEYGDGKLYEINLSNNTVSRSTTVGTAAQSVAVDPSGSAVWVGGSGYLKEVALSSFSVSNTVSVSGTVTSVAPSNGQNALVYSLVTNPCCSGGSTYTANELQLSNLSGSGTYGNSSAYAYSQSVIGQSLPNTSVSPEGCAVSVKWGNGMGACATATGFVVYDIVSNQQIMSGTTPTPVRGIASNTSNTTMYLTLPDSNLILTVPLPY
jgi:YVTN family beta-propeller protein